jgi:hypothetical protein
MPRTVANEFSTCVGGPGSLTPVVIRGIMRERHKPTVVGGLAVFVAGLLGVSLVAVALADDPPESIGGVTYRHDITAVPMPGQYLVDVACPGGTHVSGGGSFSESGTKGRMQMSAPADGPDADHQPDDLWRARHAFVTGEGGESLNAHVICVGATPTYVSRTTTIHPGQAGSVRAPCGNGLHVLGGGAALPRTGSAAFVNSTYPYDSGDAGSAPDDGWTARAFNGTGADRTLRVTAMCSGASPTYQMGTHPIAPGTAGFAHSSQCAGRHLVGMGAKMSGRAKDATISAVATEDGADADSVPDDAVTAGAAVGAGSPTSDTLTAFGVCRA